MKRIRREDEVCRLSNWDENMWAVLGSGDCGEDRLKRLVLLLERRLMINSAFTGFDVPRFAIEQALDGYNRRVANLAPSTVCFASCCDLGPLQRRFLHALAQRRDHGTSCITGDIESRVPRNMRRELDEHMPKEGDTIAEQKGGF